MGKHDKEANFKWGRPEVEAVKISYDPPKDDFYKARISALARENYELRQRVRQLEIEVGRMEQIVDKDEEITNGLIAEHKDEIDEYKDEIDDLKLQNEELKDALVRAALREVE